MRPPNADAVRFLTDHKYQYVMDAELTYQASPDRGAPGDSTRAGSSWTPSPTVRPCW